MRPGTGTLWQKQSQSCREYRCGSVSARRGMINNSSISVPLTTPKKYFLIFLNMFLPSELLLNFITPVIFYLLQHMNRERRILLSLTVSSLFVVFLVFLDFLGKPGVFGILSFRSGLSILFSIDRGRQYWNLYYPWTARPIS